MSPDQIRTLPPGIDREACWFVDGNAAPFRNLFGAGATCHTVSLSDRVTLTGGGLQGKPKGGTDWRGGQKTLAKACQD